MPLEGAVHVRQGLGHAQPRGMQGTSLLIMQDAAYRRTIGQFHRLGGRVGPDGRAWGLGTRGPLSAPLCGEDLPFDRPQPPHLPPPLDLGAAVRVEDGLGDSTDKVIGAVAVRNSWKLRGDPTDKGLLFSNYSAPPVCKLID